MFLLTDAFILSPLKYLDFAINKSEVYNRRVNWKTSAGEKYMTSSVFFHSQPNAAGLALEEFIHSTIRTNDATAVDKKRNAYSLMGHQGTYTVTVKRNGEVIAEQPMTLGPNDKNIRIKVKKNCEVKLTTKE